MEAEFQIISRRLEGTKPPPIPRTMYGGTILPSKGDRIFIYDVPLRVTEVTWIIPNSDVDNYRVLVTAEEIADSVEKLPHSRACGFRDHEHGLDCNSNCPTCGGKA